MTPHLWVFDSPLSHTHPPDLLWGQNAKLDPLHRLHGRLGVARDDRRHGGRPVRNFLKELTLLTGAKQLHSGVITLLFHNAKMAACQAWSCHFEPDYPTGFTVFPGQRRRDSPGLERSAA